MVQKHAGSLLWGIKHLDTEKYNKYIKLYICILCKIWLILYSIPSYSSLLHCNKQPLYEVKVTLILNLFTEIFSKDSLIPKTISCKTSIH